MAHKNRRARAKICDSNISYIEFLGHHDKIRSYDSIVITVSSSHEWKSIIGLLDALRFNLHLIGMQTLFKDSSVEKHLMVSLCRHSAIVRSFSGKYMSDHHGKIRYNHYRFHQAYLLLLKTCFQINVQNDIKRDM